MYNKPKFQVTLQRKRLQMAGAGTTPMKLDEFTRLIENEFDDIASNSLTGDTAFEDIEGWDSMHALILIARIEEEYGVTVTAQQLKEAKSITDLFETVKQSS